jgi:osmotically-inducible protein OsmY
MTGNTKAAPSDKSATPGTKANATPGNDDAALTAQVKTALQSDPSLRSQSIEVDTKNATVTLSGAVDSAATKAKANEVAAAVNGVVAVVDHITVKAS